MFTNKVGRRLNVKVLDSSTQEFSQVVKPTVGEETAQARFGSTQRASKFYQNQICTELNVVMQQFILEQEFFFIATSNSQGSTDSSFRAGPPGFIHILNSQQLAYPEYRGNGVLASVGNMLENPHIGLLFIDFFKTTIGLHVNGKTQIVNDQEFASRSTRSLSDIKRSDGTPTHPPECWVVVDVEEAYIHCAKHIPLFEKKEKSLNWGTDDERSKGGNFFQRKWDPK